MHFLKLTYKQVATVPVPCFLLFLCFRKVTQEIFLELDETKASHPDISRSFQRTKEETEWGPLYVRPPWSTPDDAPSPIKTPRWEKPKDPINFLETHRDPPPSSTQDREGPEALPSTLSERGIATEGLLHRHACLQSNE
jgi:hypothetical protein